MPRIPKGLVFSSKCESLQTKSTLKNLKMFSTPKEASEYGVFPKLFVVEGKDRLFVSLGDSMYHSHFIIGAGLNKTINLAVYAANQLNYIL